MVLLGSELDLQAMEAVLSSWKGQLEYARSLPGFLDITGRDVNKGNALRVLAEVEGIDPRQVIAVGDGWNDRSMFEVAGFSVAMGNGPVGLKHIADLVTPADAQNGVLWALEYILGKGMPEIGGAASNW